MSRRHAVVVAVAASLALSASLEVATAHRAKFDTRVKITQFAKGSVFLGHVRSERKACKRKRLISLWKENPGAMDGPFGTDRSNRRGIWAINPGANPPPGTYYAIAKRRVLRRGDGHRHICKRGRSPDFVLR